MVDVAAQDHYTASAIQPIVYIVANGLDFLAGNVIKYVTRYGRKNGLEDLEKARVYLNWLIERERTGTITVGSSPALSDDQILALAREIKNTAFVVNPNQLEAKTVEIVRKHLEAAR